MPKVATAERQTRTTKASDSLTVNTPIPILTWLYAAEFRFRGRISGTQNTQFGAHAFIAGRENVLMVADARPAGRWEPAELGVHPVAGGGPDGSMPVYVRRPHDELLRLVLDPEVAGSRLIVVRGEACAGKSRAAYEAVAGRLADWPLEYLPTAAALVARLEAGIPARTVLWLGELCRYADADDGAAALSGLAELLDGEGHLIITTVWPEHWEAYVTAAGARRGASDPARMAGQLMAGLDEIALYFEPSPAHGGIIDVPARFTAGELTTAAASGDPVLAAAAAAAGPDGQLTQYLAGGRGLLRRYHGPGGDCYGQAIITAAMARPGWATPARCPPRSCRTPRPAIWLASRLPARAGVRPLWPGPALSSMVRSARWSRFRPQPASARPATASRATLTSTVAAPARTSWSQPLSGAP